MEIVYDHAIPDLRITKLSPIVLEGCGIRAEDVSCGFVVSLTMAGKYQEHFIDDEMLKQMYAMLMLREKLLKENNES
jgi:hypothetical protein